MGSEVNMVVEVLQGAAWFVFGACLGSIVAFTFEIHRMIKDIHRREK